MITVFKDIDKVKIDKINTDILSRIINSDPKFWADRYAEVLETKTGQFFIIINGDLNVNKYCLSLVSGKTSQIDIKDIKTLDASQVEMSSAKSIIR